MVGGAPYGLILGLSKSEAPGLQRLATITHIVYACQVIFCEPGLAFVKPPTACRGTTHAIEPEPTYANDVCCTSQATAIGLLYGQRRGLLVALLTGTVMERGIDIDLGTFELQLWVEFTYGSLRQRLR